MAQEGIHSIKTKHLSTTLLKLDLIKAYDRVDWGYLRLLLMHVGMEQELVTWVMACSCNVHFSILVYGIPTGFFTSHRGLKQGCPLSPLLFLMVIDGLSLMIGTTKQRGFI